MDTNKDFLEDLLKEEARIGVTPPQALNEKILQEAGKKQAGLAKKERLLCLLCLLPNWILGLALVLNLFESHFAKVSLALGLYYLSSVLGTGLVFILVLMFERRKNSCAPI